MFDIWQEIFSTIKKNKLRTFLTGFAMAWGIFILIILLGSGNGLKNGSIQSYGSSQKNIMYLWPGRTSIPYKGFQKGRRIKFEDDEESYLKRRFGEIDVFASVIEKYSMVISYGQEYSTVTVSGTQPSYAFINNLEVKANNGRFLNEMDLLEKRKVIVIHRKLSDLLFKANNPIGEYVVVNKIAYKVVGVYDDDNTNDTPPVYIPYTTAKVIFDPTAGSSELVFTLDGITTEQQGEDFESSVRNAEAEKHTFDPTDRRGVYVWNMLADYLQTLNVFGAINSFIWVIGIGTLIAGIVGVSNIMLITVKERTKEFGIRKALGASPFSILKLIVLEALLVTGFFGYIGMVAGVGITELLAKILENSTPEGEMSVFSNPTVDLPIVISATLVLVIAGILAGYFPARKAVKIKPIEALRYE
ncbi:MAG: ABC transporter permease [Culturomica sp.]|jgi:putative ABC transport system permease protein|nr:ABC transporter permease [Culturomica sp.]